MEKINNNLFEKDSNVFMEELISIYDAEKKLNNSLPTMILNARNPKIANGLTKHLKFTQEHLQRLENLFTSLKEPIKN